MLVRDTFRRFTWQPRGVDLVDLAGLRVQDVENVEIELDARLEDVAYSAIQSGREMKLPSGE